MVFDRFISMQYGYYIDGELINGQRKKQSLLEIASLVL